MEDLIYVACVHGNNNYKKTSHANPHRVYACPSDLEEEQVRTLNTALKDMMKKELMNAKADNQTV